MGKESLLNGLLILGSTQIESETGTGVGLFNVNRRLMMTFGDQAALSIKSELNEGTAISFRIPKIGGRMCDANNPYLNRR